MSGVVRLCRSVLFMPASTSLGLCLLAARAHGLTALDGVHLDLDDEAGILAVCRQAAAMGFDGRR